MQARKTALEKTYKSAKKEAKSLQQKLDNVEQYIGHYSNKRTIPQPDLSQNRYHNNNRR